ncbi:toprim domain-containing protein [Thermoactinomyces sp. CICC 10522]|uniref:toprim domain-containing protein n=1 Tax=Thermoactinomyces sp. CICC 10522 TaxID=2767427 RepID=UPI0018DB83AA|nr:toprim domain-containing protein [Thermoactinomyces sp. CICC 10522]
MSNWRTQNGYYKGLSEADIFGYPRNQFNYKINRAGWVRLYCPVHGGDRSLSFALNAENGFFSCWQCGVQGFTVEATEKWKEEQRQNKKGPKDLRSSRPSFMLNKTYSKESLAWKQGTDFTDWSHAAEVFQFRFDGSIAERYVKWRGISPEVAKKYGLGFCPPNEWPNKKNGKTVMFWKRGRVVFPHSDLDGRVVNLYGRAIGVDDVPVKLKHTHLPGPRGIFNAPACQEDTIFICEGPFDALSLISAGYTNSIAIFGANGLRWEWLKSKTLVFCLDQDATGSRAWKELAMEAKLRGKQVYWLDEEVYQGCKDLNEVWVNTGFIKVGSLGDEQKQEPIPWDDELNQMEYEMTIDFFKKEYGDIEKWAQQFDPELIDVLATCEKRVKLAMRIKDTEMFRQQLLEWNHAYKTIVQVYKEVAAGGSSE